MTKIQDEKDLGHLVKALKSYKINDLSQSRLEMGKRHFLASITANSRQNMNLFSWKTAWSVSICALFAVFAFIFAGFHTDSKNKTDYIDISGSWSMESGDIVAEGSKVHISGTKPAKIIYPDNSVVWATPQTIIHLSDNFGKEARLISGHVVFNVKKRSENNRFTVETPHLKLIVVGTLFSVTTHEKKTVIRLHKGNITVKAANKSINLKKGREIEISDDGIFKFRPININMAKVDLSIIGKSSRTKKASSLKIAPHEKIHPGSLDKKSDNINTENINTFKTKQPVNKKSTRTSTLKTLLQEVRALYMSGSCDEVLALTKAAGLNPDVYYYRASALETLGRWKEAAKTYALVSQKGSKRKQATYLSAKTYFLAKDYQKSMEYARKSIAEGGAISSHANFLLIRSLVKLRRHRNAVREIRKYIHVHHNGANIEDVMFFLGYCQFKIGGIKMSIDSYRDYLKMYPQGKHANKVRKILGS